MKRATNLLLFLAAGACVAQAPADFDPAIFKSPPAAYRGHAMWRFNLNTLNDADIISGLAEVAKLNYGGFFIEASGGPTTGLSDAYMKQFRRTPSSQGVVFASDEYFQHYRTALEQAKKLGLEVILYDDYSFPTGTVAGQLYSQHPEAIAKSLNLVEENLFYKQPGTFDLAIPEGIYVGAVLVDYPSRRFVREITERPVNGRLHMDVPAGASSVMAFYLAEGKARVVDYLDPKSMDAFISMTYEKYARNFGNEFGGLIKQTFYDEPSMHHADRTWTPGFNAAFEKKFGYSPLKLYPALWFDIGPDTAAARNALFGFRASLFQENFTKRLDDWCAAHHLQFGGHLDQEEPLNPVPLSGDLMKVFEHQTLPTVDDIWWWGRSNPSYKIVTSAAFNYDHPIARAETYSAYRGLTERIAYQVAMDQFAMGINFQIPDRTEQPARPALNDYVGRLSYLLQHGRHVADIAVLYPIASLNADYRFIGGVGLPHSGKEIEPQVPENIYAREGGPAPGIDFQDVGESLYRALRVDFTYLHPEVLVERCTVEDGHLILNNRENREEFRVLVVPSGDVISVAAAEKIREFYRAGGQVIATGFLPTRAAEFGKDAQVRDAIYEVFGSAPDRPLTASVLRAQDRQNFYVFWYYLKKNPAGGQAIFIPNTHPWLMDYVLKLVLPQRDVDIQEPIAPIRKGNEYEGALTYIHKVKAGRDIYFFANSTDKAIDTKVVLRGARKLRIWNPHTGQQQMADFTPGDGTTTIRLKLASVESLLFIGEP